MKGLIKKALVGAISLTMLGIVFINVDVFAKNNAVHNVTYIYGSKTVTVPVVHGGNATIPTDTAVPGYKFISWVGSAVNVTEDRVILGAYQKDNTPESVATAVANTLPGSQTWTSWGNAYRINSNKSAPFPEWWKDLNLPKGTPGVTCAVHWYNGHNGELWKTDIIPYGSSCPDPGEPCIAGYEFYGWEGDWTNVTEDRAIKAWYFKRNTVQYVDSIHDEIYDEQRVRDGDSAWVTPILTHNAPFKNYEYANGDKYNGEPIYNDTTLYAVFGK